MLGLCVAPFPFFLRLAGCKVQSAKLVKEVPSGINYSSVPPFASCCNEYLLVGGEKTQWKSSQEKNEMYIRTSQS